MRSDLRYLQGCRGAVIGFSDLSPLLRRYLCYILKAENMFDKSTFVLLGNTRPSVSLP